MTDIENQFHEHAKHLVVTPTSAAWDRVEAKLHMQRSRRKMATARMLSIAAALLLVVTLSFIVIFYSQDGDQMSSKEYSMMIGELRTDGTYEESIFDVDKIRKSYADLGLMHN